MDGVKLAEAIIERVRSVYGVIPPEGLQLHRPFIGPTDWSNVASCAADDPVGYSYINLLEELVAARCNVAYAVATSSGTAALHLALLAVGVRAGDRVSVPPITFAATAAAVVYCGAIPVFDTSGAVEVDAEIAVDLLGIPDERLGRRAPMVPLIEDAAEAFGSAFHGRPLGSFGDVGILSFNNNKIVTSGGGGMLLTNKASIAQAARHLATTARIKHPFVYEHDAIGFNYRMGNLAAALAVGQVQRLDEILRFKQALHEHYVEAFKDLSEAPIMTPPDGVNWNGWLNAILVPAADRDVILTEMQAHGINARAMFTPLPLQPPYSSYPRNSIELEQAIDAFGHLILLPSGSIP